MLVSRFIRNLIMFLGLTLVFAILYQGITAYYQNEIDLIKIKKKMCKIEVGATEQFKDTINYQLKNLKEKRKILGWLVPSEIDTIKEIK